MKNRFFLEERDKDNFEKKKEGVENQCGVWFEMRNNENQDEWIENKNLMKSIMVVTNDKKKLKKSSSI